jgi:hypothetical protein
MRSFGIISLYIIWGATILDIIGGESLPLGQMNNYHTSSESNYIRKMSSQQYSNKADDDALEGPPDTPEQSHSGETVSEVLWLYTIVSNVFVFHRYLSFPSSFLYL